MPTALSIDVRYPLPLTQLQGEARSRGPGCAAAVEQGRQPGTRTLLYVRMLTRFAPLALVMLAACDHGGDAASVPPAVTPQELLARPIHEQQSEALSHASESLHVGFERAA